MIETTTRVVCDHCGRCVTFLRSDAGLDRLSYTTKSINESLEEEGWRIVCHTKLRAEHTCPACDRVARSRNLRSPLIIGEQVKSGREQG